MAITVVQHPLGITGATGGVAFNITLTSTGAGEAIFVIVYSTNTVDPGITDNKSNTYVKDSSAQFSGPSNRLACFSCLSPVAGVTTVTVTPAAGGGNFCIAYVITATPGAGATFSFDKTSTHQSTTGSTFTSNATATLASATQLAIGMGATGNTGAATLAASGSWTNAAAQVDNTGDGDAARAMYQILAATTGIAATGTCGTGDQPVVALIATYQAVTSGATTPSYFNLTPGSVNPTLRARGNSASSLFDVPYFRPPVFGWNNPISQPVQRTSPPQTVFTPWTPYVPATVILPLPFGWFRETSQPVRRPVQNQQAGTQWTPPAIVIVPVTPPFGWYMSLSMPSRVPIPSNTGIVAWDAQVITSSTPVGPTGVHYIPTFRRRRR